MNSIRFFVNYCWTHNKKYVIYTLVYQLLMSILPLLLVVFPKFIIDELVGSKRVEYLVLYVLILLGYQLIGGYLANVFKKKAFIEKSLLFIKFQSELTKKMATADFERIESSEFLDQKEKASKFLYGEGQGFGAVFDNFASIIGNLIIFIGIIGIISTLNIFLLFIFVLLSISTSYFDKKTKQSHVEWDMAKSPIERKTNYLINLVESFQYAKEIRIFNLSSWLTAKVDKHLSEGNNFYTKQIEASVRVETINLISSFIRDAITYLFLISQYLTNKISIGAFSMYVTSIATFSSLLKQVLESLATIRQYENYFEALSLYLQLTPVKKNLVTAESLPTDFIDMTFKEVWFKYPGADDYALKKINFKIRAGDNIAIVGENGSGKTTLIKLICRLYVPTKGKILINGLDIQDFEIEEYSKLISSVFQDFKLFSFSIRENLVFENKNNISDCSMYKSLKDNGFNIDKYQWGLETSIYKNFDITGFEPSGGEGQKIALARAELKNAPMIILDEPTAAMDPKAELELYSRFNLLTKNKTAFYISHRLASTKFCDYIFCIKEGEIVENGSQEELLLKNGIYKELYEMQSELYSVK